MSENFLIVGANGLKEEAEGFSSADFVDSSAGAGDAGKPIKLDSSGKISGDMMPALALTEVQVVADIAARDALTAQEGDFARVLDASADPEISAGAASYVYDGSSWILTKSDDEVLSIQGQTGAVVLDSDDIGEGSTNLYYTEPRFDASFSGKDTDDLAEGSNLYFTDARARTAAVVNTLTGGETDQAGSVDAVKSYIDNNIAGVQFLAGENITKGDALFLSADNTVSIQDDLSIGRRIIGLAVSTESLGANIISARNDTVLPGVLTGATAGQTYYWDGSSITSSKPTGSGSHVWEVGFAKNATDLFVEIRHTKKNV